MSATPVVLWAGRPFFERAWASLRNRSLNMFTLVAMGTGVSWVYSVIALIAPNIFAGAFRMMDGSVAVDFESVGGDHSARVAGTSPGTACAGIHGQRDQGADGSDAKSWRAVFALDGSDEEILLETVTLGDMLRVRPGEKVPVDGIVIEGRGSVDEAWSRANHAGQKRPARQ